MSFGCQSVPTFRSITLVFRARRDCSLAFFLLEGVFCLVASFDLTRRFAVVFVVADSFEVNMNACLPIFVKSFVAFLTEPFLTEPEQVRRASYADTVTTASPPPPIFHHTRRYLLQRCARPADKLDEVHHTVIREKHRPLRRIYRPILCPHG